MHVFETRHAAPRISGRDAAWHSLPRSHGQPLSLVSILFSGLYGNCYEKKQLSRVICVIMNGLFLICCSETVSLGVWSCHVALEVDCRLVGRWFGKNCKR